MSKAFGTKFVIVNDIQQQLPTHIFGGGPECGDFLSDFRESSRGLLIQRDVDTGRIPIIKSVLSA